MSQETPRILHANINQMIEGLRPHMSLRITLPNWTRQDQQVHQPVANSNPPENHVIDIEQSIPNQQVSVPETGNIPQQNDPIDEASASILRHSPEAQAVLNVILRYIPFLLLALTKFVIDYIGSIFIFFGLLFAFGHANFVLKREIAKQGRRSALALAGIACNVIGSVIFVYYIFGLNKTGLYLTIFNETPPLSASKILWLVAVSDLTLKLFTILLKMVIVSLPGRILPYASRGKHFLFLEAFSQLYRSITPVRPWLTYLLEAYEGPETAIGIIMSLIYTISKFRDINLRFLFFRRACGKLIENSNLGSSPSQQELITAGSECPICHDSFNNPVRLQCRHIFCEGCVTIWLDRERTCPLCRASIVEDPAFRDGSTTHFLQLF